MNYDVNYFIEKFSAIDESLWNDFVQQHENKTRCALGHCMPLKEFKNPENPSYGEATEEGVALVRLFKNVGWGLTSRNYVTDVNNGRSELYQQPTPKQRILAALYDIKKMQQPQPNYPDITQSLAVLPVEERSDVVPNPELLTNPNN